MPRNRKTKTSLLRMLALASALGLPLQANAINFSRMTPVSDGELEQVRGGFMTSNGMLIDFGLTTRTIIDGDVIREVKLNSAKPEEIDPNALQTMIRVNEAGASVEGMTLDDLPSMITVIQNDTDNKVIQNFNILDIAASNVQAFRAQTFTSILNHQIVLTLK